ncbi:LIC_13355 family lipoprotein [Leptospira sp. 96542]|nr:LIC_13355 family lipoprotein [Leptospira sp. 96542]
MNQNFKIQKKILALLYFTFLGCETQSPNNNILALLPLLSQISNSNQICPKGETPSNIHLANTVVNLTKSSVGGFDDVTKAINGVCGTGEFSGSLDVYALDITGASAQITLSFGGKTVKNVAGSVDFVVYDNTFRISGESSTYNVDPAVVTVSQDGINFCGFNPVYSGDSSTITQISVWQRFAGLRPVYYNMLSANFNAEQLFTPDGNGFLLGGGDGFDLEDLSDNADLGADGCNTALRNQIKVNGFHYIRIRTAADLGFSWPAGSYNGSDIDGVVAKQVD